MKAEEAIERLRGVIERQPHRDWSVLVKVIAPGAIGGTPCVGVKRLDAGFDWDSGKVMLETDVPLTTLTPEDVAAIHKSAKAGQSWHAFQLYKKQVEQINALKVENASLKAAIASDHDKADGDPIRERPL